MSDEKYIKCYLSEIGHNNFWYPTQTEILISSTSAYEKLSWISGAPGENLTAIKVRKSCIFPLEINENTAKNISSIEKDDYTVVWIKNNLLPPHTRDSNS